MLETIVQYMALIGIPSIFAIVIYIGKSFIAVAKQVIILQRAQKAQMRAQLLEKYEYYFERGYVLQIELDEWMNQYSAYHDLVGENEVLDDRKDKIKNIPNHPPVN